MGIGDFCEGSTPFLLDIKQKAGWLVGMGILANQKKFPCGILRCFLRDTAEKLQDRFQRAELRMRRIMSMSR